ncbi:MAG TPA: DUF1028 domain-containing protein [Trebonia sp.]|jgi:uncharacterized Ntn-hydrolase superfamily protein|nr:DUF1028 domain-containing protein [Trebonia sp.]
MTYSITAYDRATGRWGVAVQSCVLVVGTRVPMVREGAGALAVQAGSPSWYRQPGAELLTRGTSARDIVAALAALPKADVGQFAVVDLAGQAAAHTGPECTVAAGHAIGDGVVTAANLVARDGMWHEMLRAYETAAGAFEDRLLAALAAGEATGGDVRGRQSAAMLVSAGQDHGTGERDGEAVFETDLRVDDAADPVPELARVLAVKQAHDELRRALADASQGRWGPAAERLTAVAGHAPDDALVTVWTGLALVLAGREADAGPYLRAAAQGNPFLIDYLSREPLLKDPRERDLALRLAGQAGARAAAEETG